MGTQHCGLAGKIGIEVLAGELSGGSMERRIRQMKVGLLGDLLGRSLEDRFSHQEEVGQLEIVDGHWARRSKAW